MIKKHLIVIALILSSFVAINAQSFIPKGPYRSILGDIVVNKGAKKGSAHHTIMPFVGFENFLFANAGSLGCDFKYSRASGFALYGNIGFVFGSYTTTQKNSNDYYGNTTTEVKSSIFSLSLEALMGYSKTFAQKHTIVVALGLQGSYGLGVMEYIAGAFRLEYSYLITEKYGIHFSFTDGVGLIAGDKNWSLNRASLKAGPVIYF